VGHKLGWIRWRCSRLLRHCGGSDGHCTGKQQGGDNLARLHWNLLLADQRKIENWIAMAGAILPPEVIANINAITLNLA
jgi:hypothetical protein